MKIVAVLCLLISPSLGQLSILGYPIVIQFPQCPLYTNELTTVVGDFELITPHGCSQNLEPLDSIPFLIATAYLSYAGACHCNEPVEKSVRVVCGQFGSVNTFQVLEPNDPDVCQKINCSDEVLVVIPGWVTPIDHPDFVYLYQQYFQYRTGSLCVVDYTNYSNCDYPSTVKIHLPKVKNYVVPLLEQLFANGVSANRLLFAGHSLGAHLSGWISRSLSQKPAKIIGMSVAGPLFYGVLYSDRRLRPDDAWCVQILFTDKGRLGISLELGSQSIAFNCDGYCLQPTCSHLAILTNLVDNDYYCCHAISVRYFANSLNPNNPMVGQLCDNYKQFRDAPENCTVTDLVGLDSECTTRGKLYLNYSPQ